MTTEQTSRIPKPSYLGTNGFKTEFTEPERINERNIQEALRRHRRAEFFLEHQKREIPSFEDMQAEIQRDELEAIDDRIATLQTEYSSDLERLHAASSADYKQEVMDQYVSRDYTAGYGTTEEMAAWQTELLELYENSRNVLRIEWQDTYEQIRHSYLSQLLSLEESKRNIEKEKEKMKRQRELEFPKTPEEFNAKPQDVRLRAARFLVADQTMQERFVNKYGWAWRQVLPLLEIFKKDATFAADVRGMVLSEQNVRDPRKPRA